MVIGAARSSIGCTQTKGWKSATTDLTSFAGQRVYLNFLTHDDGVATDPSWMYIDNMSVTDQKRANWQRGWCRRGWRRVWPRSWHSAASDSGTHASARNWGADTAYVPHAGGA